MVIKTPKPQVFDFFVFDRTSLIMRVKKYCEERGFSCSIPHVKKATLESFGEVEEHTIRCSDDYKCGFRLVYRNEANKKGFRLVK